MRVAPATPWTQALFHVLAHVDAGAVAASCHSPAYVAWAASRLGAASDRSLAEDARTLARVARTHDDLARLQLLATLFDDEAQAMAASARDLAELGDSNVADASALRAARSIGAVAEILRAATELELPLVASLEPPSLDEAALDAAFVRVGPLAPELEGFDVRSVRALGVRGRAFPRVIFVGTPGIAGADEEHVAWQAAHESIVARVPGARSFEDVEREAIARLRARARAAGSGDAHARWLARFDLSALGAIPDVTDGT